MTIADLMAVAVVMALGGAPSDGDLASGQVHGAPMASPSVTKVERIAQAAPAPQAAPVRDGGTVAAPGGSPQAPAPKPGPSEPPAAAMTAEVKALVERVQGFYEKTQDFTAKFQQDYTYKTFKRKQTSSGTVAFKKPGLMRWEYLQPSARTFVISNDKVYAYDPQALTLTKGNFDSSQLSASVTFLWGKGKLADEFNIAKVACKDCKGVLLELTPKKPDPRFRMVKLEVDPATAQVRRSIVIDPDGSENAITFSELKTNTGLKDDAFKLTPAANTQVIDMTRGGK